MKIQIRMKMKKMKIHFFLMVSECSSKNLIKHVSKKHTEKETRQPNTRQNTAPGQGNTMPVKDGESTKKRRKKCLTCPSKRARNDVASTAPKNTLKRDTAAQNKALGQESTMPVKALTCRLIRIRDNSSSLPLLPAVPCCFAVRQVSF